MSKISLTFNDLTPAIAYALIQIASGGSGSAPQPAAPVTNDDDDDNGPVNTSAPAVDSAGIPWDERIHAKSKGTKADGTWKRARGVTDETVAAVEAELRAKVASPVPQQPQAQPGPFVPSQPAPQPTAPAAPTPEVPQNSAPLQPPAPTAPQVALEQPAPAPAAPTGALDFQSFMLGLQRSMTAQIIDLATLQGFVSEINTAWGTQLTQITDLQTRPDMIPWVVELLRTRGKWIEG